MKPKTEKQRERMLNSLKQYQLSKARNIVAKSFQEMIRWEYAADHEGVLHCCTCDARGLIGENKFDAGHYFSRRTPLVFDSRNCHPQCKTCNRAEYGKPEAYGRFMRKMYGPDTVLEMQNASRQFRKFTHDELCDLKIEFLARIKAAKARLK